MRFWEIDFARGCAVCAMVLFNWLYALGFLGIIAFDASQTFWWLYANLVVFAFVFLSGISLHLSLLQGKNAFLRGLKILGCGLLITAITMLFVPQQAVYFGILHLVGISIILGIFFNRISPDYLAGLGLAIVIAGVILMPHAFGFQWLAWLGLKPVGFQSLDYEPLLPWFGVFLFGMSAAKRYYADGKRRFTIGQPRASLLRFAGSHSLAIYLIHIPLLLFALWLAGIDILQGLKNA